MKNSQSLVLSRSWPVGQAQHDILQSPDKVLATWIVRTRSLKALTEQTEHKITRCHQTWNVSHTLRCRITCKWKTSSSVQAHSAAFPFLIVCWAASCNFTSSCSSVSSLPGRGKKCHNRKLVNLLRFSWPAHASCETPTSASVSLLAVNRRGINNHVGCRCFKTYLSRTGQS